MTWRAEDERKLLIEFLAWLKEQDPFEDEPPFGNEGALIDRFMKGRAIT